MLTTNLRKVGGSVMLAVPPAILDLLHLDVGAPSVWPSKATGSSSRLSRSRATHWRSSSTPPTRAHPAQPKSKSGSTLQWSVPNCYESRGHLYGFVRPDSGLRAARTPSRARHFPDGLQSADQAPCRTPHHEWRELRSSSRLRRAAHRHANHQHRALRSTARLGSPSTSRSQSGVATERSDR